MNDTGTSRTSRQYSAVREGRAAGRHDEVGQSIVLITLVFVGLLAFIALAVDAGFAFARSAQFSRAVDSAALAGVVDLQPNTADVITPTLRAAQFLGANNWPTPTLTTFVTTRSLTVQGLPQFTVTATAPIETFFFRILGFDEFDIAHSATAAYYAASEMLTGTGVDLGQMREAHQFISGPDGCTKEGDPVMPEESTVGNPNVDRFLYDARYTYRIVIPPDYTATYANVRVELFDPDSANLRTGNSATVTHTLADGRPPEYLSCSGTAGDGDRCIINTGEELLQAVENPFWLQRVDQTYDANCNLQPGNATGDADTTFTLYALDSDGDRTTFGTYANTNSDANLTDLQWVTPGLTLGGPGITGTFEVAAASIPADTETGNRYLYLDVATVEGSSLNGWDLWAGPPGTFAATDVNLRNVEVADNVFSIENGGVQIYALGRMPVFYLIGNSFVTLPLLNLPIESGDGTIYVSLFDYDPSSPPPNIQFTIDSVAQNIFRMCAKVEYPPDAGHSGNCADPNQFLEAACDVGTNCDHNWTRPYYSMGIPGTDTTIGQFFAGGILQVNFVPGREAMTWSAKIASGRPFLTR